MAGFSQSLLAQVPVQEWITPQKIRVIFVPDKTTELVSVHFAFKSTGSRNDPAGKEGLTALMTQVLLERTKEDSDRYTLEKKLKSLGVIQSLHYNIDADNIHFWFKCPKENLKAVFDIIKIVITTPVFDAKELAKAKNFDPAGARLATTSEQEFASKILLQKLLSSHPYATPSTGTLEGRQAVTIADLEEAAKNRFARNVLVFSVVGDLSSPTLTQYIDDTFAKLPEKASLPAISNATIKSDGEIIVIPKDAPQSGVVFGQAGVPVQNKNYLAWLIINDILGGKPFTSQLWLEAREKQGLVYSINTDLVNAEFASLLIGGFECDNTAVNKVIHLVRNEWKNIKDKGIPEAKFKASKTSLQGSFVLTFSTPDGIARYLLQCYLNNLPTHYINQRKQLLNAVTLKEVNQVAKTILNTEKLTFVVVGNPEETPNKEKNQH
jgi:zinc protease